MQHVYVQELGGWRRERKIPILFLFWKKSRFYAKIVESIRINNGQTVTNQSDILHVQKTYIANLYKKKLSSQRNDEQINRFMLNASVPRLSEEHMKSCEGILTEIEVLETLKEI